MEDGAFEKHQRMMKRRSMEARCGAEVRRLHIVYFLSRKGGGIEHPHLIRVNHLHRSGVRLRDVKRWLSELRDNSMPESYSWSYKRRYRMGYVWQDLQDDDLVTPISDNEYVLKGSEIASAITSIGVTKDLIGKKQSYLDEGQKATPQYQNQSLISRRISTKSSSKIEEEYPVFGSEASTLTDDSLNLETEKSIIDNTDGIKQEKLDEKPSCDRKTDTPKNWNNKVQIDGKITKHAASSNAASVPPNFSKSKSCSSFGTSSNMFRNIMSCGSSNTDDSVTVTINNHHLPFFNICSKDQKTIHSTETCKGDRRIGAPHRIYNTPWMQRQWSDSRNKIVKDSMQDKEESKGQTWASAAAYKPIYGPNCSQCGKPFKPEKLHAHMKSCKGMKALSKNASVAKKMKQKSTAEPQNKYSVSGMSKDPIGEEQSCPNEGQKATPENQNQSLISRLILTKSAIEIEEEYPVFGSEASTLTDDSLNFEIQKSIINNTDGIKQENLDVKPPCNGKIDNPKKRNTKVKIDEKIIKNATSSNAASVQPNFSKSKSCSSFGTSSNMFRNMMSCGAINTDDAEAPTINTNHRPFFNICSNDQKTIYSAYSCERDRKIGAPHRINPSHQRQWSGRENRNDEVKDSMEDKQEIKGQNRASAGAFKPIYGPKCSQCGKPFKPEKLHAHMKSCKVMKSLSKNANTSLTKKIEQKSSARASK